MQVQLGQQLIAGDQELQLGDADQELLLHDVGLEVEHLGQAGFPVGLEPGLGRRRDRDDPAIVGRGQPEDVAELPLGRDHVRGPGHQVEVELFQPLGGLGDVGDGSPADDKLGLLAIEDFLGQADGPVGAPELDVCLGQVPVLLLDRPDVCHDLGLEPPDGRVGIQPRRSRSVARLASRPTGLAGGLAGQRGATQQGLSQGELKVGGVGRGPDQERAVLVRPVDVVHDADRATGLRLLRQAGLERQRVVHRDDRVLGSGQARASRPARRC